MGAGSGEFSMGAGTVMSQSPLSRWGLGSAPSPAPFLWSRGSSGRERGSAVSALSLPLGLSCSAAFPPQCLRVSVLGGRRGRGCALLCALKCPEHWAVLGMGSKWHSGWLPWLLLGLLCLPGLCRALCREQNCQERSKRTVGRAGEPESAGTGDSDLRKQQQSLLCPLPCQVRGELSGRPSWKVRPSSPCSTRASSAAGPW